MKCFDGFYRHPSTKDGYSNKCKECTKKAVRENYQKRKEYYQAYDQMRNRARRDYIKRKNKIYAKVNKDRVDAAKKRWIELHKEKRAAHIALGNALKSGLIKKGVCQICKTADVEAHHFNYKNPLAVIWLCKTHHEMVHWWIRWNKREAKNVKIVRDIK